MEIQELTFDTKVKVIFGKRGDERTPMIGIIVGLSDEKYLSSKGMVRMVLSRYIDDWDGETVSMTRVYVAKDFSQVIPMNGKDN